MDIRNVAKKGCNPQWVRYEKGKSSDFVEAN